ncbi:MAG: lipopolysaccharide biosynthesis protein, partial [Verrucomicrobiae bacterium]|nr:lipopolysaccharide biosynthesis protein [Verrucomicrobiae bacterium]
LRYLSRSLEAKDDSSRTGDYFSYFGKLYLRIGLASLLLTLLGTWAVPWFLEDPESIHQARIALLLTGVPLSLAFFFRVHRTLIRSHVLYSRTILAGLLRTVVYTAGILLFIPDAPNVTTLALTWSAGIIAEQALLVWLARDLVPAKRAVSPLDAGERKEVRHFAAKMIGWSIASFLRARIDSQILAAYVSTTAVTHYSVGSRFIQMFTDIVNAIFGGHFLAGFARIYARDGQSGAVDRFLSTLRACVPLALIAGSAIYFLGPPFIDRWLGPGFEESHLVIRILAIPTTLMLMQYPLGSFLGSQNRHGAMATVSFVGGVLNLVASLVLVRFLGFSGVIISTAAELSLTALLMWPLIAHRKGGISLFAYAKSLVQPTLVLLPAIALSGFGVAYLKPDTYMTLALAGAAMSALFALNAWLLLLEKDERRYVTSTLAKVLRRRGDGGAPPSA